MSKLDYCSWFDTHCCGCGKSFEKSKEPKEYEMTLTHKYGKTRGWMCESCSNAIVWESCFFLPGLGGEESEKAKAEAETAWFPELSNEGEEV